MLKRETVRELTAAAGMRNILVHSYSRVDPALVHGAATEGLGTLERFQAEIGGWLAHRWPTREARRWLRRRALIDDRNRLTIPVLGRWIREEELA